MDASLSDERNTPLTVAQLIRLYRRKRGLKQKDFSAIAGFSERVMARIESGERLLRAHELTILADALDLNAEERQALSQAWAAEQNRTPTPALDHLVAETPTAQPATNLDQPPARRFRMPVRTRVLAALGLLIAVGAGVLFLHHPPAVGAAQGQLIGFEHAARCKWLVSVRVTGLQPRAPVYVSSHYAATECTTGTFSVHTWSQRDRYRADRHGTWAETYIQRDYGSYRLTISDHAGHTVNIRYRYGRTGGPTTT